MKKLYILFLFCLLMVREHNNIVFSKEENQCDFNCLHDKCYLKNNVKACYELEKLNSKSRINIRNIQNNQTIKQSDLFDYFLYDVVPRNEGEKIPTNNLFNDEVRRPFPIYPIMRRYSENYKKLFAALAIDNTANGSDLISWEELPWNIKVEHEKIKHNFYNYKIKTIDDVYNPKRFKRSFKYISQLAPDMVNEYIIIGENKKEKAILDAFWFGLPKNGCQDHLGISLKQKGKDYYFLYRGTLENTPKIISNKTKPKSKLIKKFDEKIVLPSDRERKWTILPLTKDNRYWFFGSNDFFSPNKDYKANNYRLREFVWDDKKQIIVAYDTMAGAFYDTNAVEKEFLLEYENKYYILTFIDSDYITIKWFENGIFKRSVLADDTHACI